MPAANICGRHIRAIVLGSKTAFERVSNLTYAPYDSDADTLIDVRWARLPSIAPDSDYDPRDHREVAQAIKPWMAYFNLLRTMCGAGLLGVPIAITLSGLVLGAVFCVLMGLILIHTQHLLLQNLIEVSRQLKIPHISYRYGFRLALLHGPPIWHPIGNKGPKIIATFMCLNQLGICAVGVVLTADSVRDILDWQSYKPAMLVLLIPFMLMQFYMKNLKIVSYVSLFGTVLNTIGLILIFYHIFKEPQHRGVLYRLEAPCWLTTTGTLLFCLSAVGVILSLERAMKKPKIFTARFGVINVGVMVSTLLAMVFGVLGCWAFGSMEENILRSLPFEDTTSMVTIGVYLVSVAMTYPIQCFPGVAVILEVIKHRTVSRPSDKTLTIIENITRPGFVLLSFAIAYWVPYQAPLVAFVGNLCTSMLAIVFPAMMDISLRYGVPKGYGKYKIYLIKNLLLMWLGIVCWIFGVYFCGYLIYIRMLSTYSTTNDRDFF